jgi:hypothetical protein
MCLSYLSMSSNCMLMVECGTIWNVLVRQFKMFVIWTKVKFAKFVVKPTAIMP